MFSWYVWQCQAEQTAPFPVFQQAFHRFMTWAEAEPFYDSWATDIRGLATVRQSFIVKPPLSVIWSFTGAFTRDNEDSRDLAWAGNSVDRGFIQNVSIDLVLILRVRRSVAHNFQPVSFHPWRYTPHSMLLSCKARLYWIRTWLKIWPQTASNSIGSGLFLVLWRFQSFSEPRRWDRSE